MVLTEADASRLREINDPAYDRFTYIFGGWRHCLCVGKEHGGVSEELESTFDTLVCCQDCGRRYRLKYVDQHGMLESVRKSD